MPELPTVPLPLIGAIVIFAILLIVAMIFVKNYVKAGPNEVAVFFGRGEPKYVRGGGRFRIPGLETVKRRSLQPFKINIKVENVFSSDNVPVIITGFSQVAFGITDAELRTSMSKYLDSDDIELHGRFTEILQGNMREIASGMTIEQLNNDRPELARRILEIATASFQPLGMSVPTFNIQNVDDNNGYLAALGKRRIAEVQRDAAIGQANAERETMEQQAEANRLGKTAQAASETAIAQVERDRDLEFAPIAAIIDAERATSAQQGPLAEANAKADVAVAEAKAKQRGEEANIEYERQRSERSRAAQQADVIIPAEARRQASVIQAQGERDASIATAEGAKQSTIANAQAQAEQRKLSSSAEAEATKALAAAKQTELEALAAGEAAKLFAQAEGQEKLAAAYNMMSDAAGRLQILPKLIETMPLIARAIADGVKIDKMVVMDGGASGANGSGIQRAAGAAPAILNQLTEVMNGFGFDISGLLDKAGVSTDTAPSDTSPYGVPALVPAASSNGTEPTSQQ